jgi:hypothetical protein
MDLKRTNNLDLTWERMGKDEKHDLLADSHNIVNRWKYEYYFRQVLNKFEVSYVRPKCGKLSHYKLKLIFTHVLRMRLLCEVSKGVSRQILSILSELFKKKLKVYVLESIRTLILTGTAKNYLFTLQ